MSLSNWLLALILTALFTLVSNAAPSTTLTLPITSTSNSTSLRLPNYECLPPSRAPLEFSACRLAASFFVHEFPNPDPQHFWYLIHKYRRQRYTIPAPYIRTVEGCRLEVNYRDLPPFMFASVRPADVTDKAMGLVRACVGRGGDKGGGGSLVLVDGPHPQATIYIGSSSSGSLASS